MEDILPQPLVSAIVSTYNSERFIRGCIEDLELQTISDQIEIIVIDSASSQDEGAIVRELQSRYGNIRYLRTDQRETVYASWNRGIALARGRYITNANTDDRHRRDAFELMTRVMDVRPEIDLVYADVLVTKIPNETFMSHTPSGRYTWYDWDRNILLDKGCFIGPQPMWRRSLHELYGGFDPNYVTSGDYEFWLRISQTSDFFHIRQPLGLYLAHPDSIEHRNEDRKGSENSKVLNLYRQAAKKRCIVGLIPLQKMSELAAENYYDLPHSDFRQMVDLIEGRLIPRIALSANLRGNYQRVKAKLLESVAPSAQLIEEYVSGVEHLLLGNKEWYVNRRSVEDTTTDDAMLRLEVLSTAIQRARVLFQRGDEDRAVSILLNQGIKTTPSSPAAYLELAEILLAAGRYEDTLQVLPEMPPLTDASRQQEILAICYAALGQEDAAYQAALLAAGSPRALVTLGTLTARSGNLLEAENFFHRALEADPCCSSAWLSLGMLLWGNGDQEGAYQAVRKAVTVDPLNNEAVKILRDMAKRNQYNADTLQVISHAVQLYPDSRNLGRNHAEILVQCGRDREALEACESFLVRFGINEEILSLALNVRKRIGLYNRLAEPSSLSISLCMIVKNEANNLPACLATLKPIADELIIVDTGSSDRTVDIATIFGSKVVFFAWNGNFSDARNYAIEKANGRWILIIDADEAISTSDHENIRRAVLESIDKKVAWSVLTRNYTTKVHAQGWVSNDGSYSHEERADGWHPSWKVRLFPNQTNIRFSGEVHEMVEYSLQTAGLTVKKAPFVVHHYGGLVEGADEVTEKRREYFEIGMKKLDKNPNDIGALSELAVQAGEMGYFDEAITLWDRLLKIAPNTIEALFNKGYALIGLQRYQEALDISETVMNLAPGHKEAAFNYGTSALYVGKPQDAVRKLEPLLQQHPEYPPLLAILTLLFLLTGEREKAIFTCSTLKKLNYAISDYAKDRAGVLSRLGREEQARKLLFECTTIGILQGSGTE